MSQDPVIIKWSKLARQIGSLPYYKILEELQTLMQKACNSDYDLVKTNHYYVYCLYEFLSWAYMSLDNKRVCWCCGGAAFAMEIPESKFLSWTCCDITAHLKCCSFVRMCEKWFHGYPIYECPLTDYPDLRSHEAIL